MWPKDVRKSDLRIEYYRGSGPGGQKKNKTSSACRLTHVPTGIQAQCEDDRQQHKNREIAFRRLAKKLTPLMTTKSTKEISDRRIRNYHEPRNEVRDVRIPNKTWTYSGVIYGNDLDKIINWV